MSDAFFDRPILNPPYAPPARHWELDAAGQLTQRVAESRRPADFVTPIPKPRKYKSGAGQDWPAFDNVGIVCLFATLRYP